MGAEQTPEVEKVDARILAMLLEARASVGQAAERLTAAKGAAQFIEFTIARDHHFNKGDAIDEDGTIIRVTRPEATPTKE